MNALAKEVEGLPFLEKLIAVFEHGEVDFWEDRKNPPNLSVDELEQVLHRIDRADNLSWIKRESKKGPRGKTGEDNCFKFTCQVEFGGLFDIEIKHYFVKGYFFDKANLRGVTIQSFREE